MPKTQAKRGMSPRELDALRKRYVAEQKQADSASKWQLANDIVSGINDIVGRGVIAPILGIPGDINQAIYDAGAFVNNKIKDVEVATGMVKQPRYVQPTQGNAYLGSEDIGNRMQQAGLVSSERRPMTELAASLVSPGAAAKTAINAPKTAMNMLRMAENLEAPSRGVRNAQGMYIPRGQMGAIDLGVAEAPQAKALREAQINAAKPVSEGGLGLRPDNTPEERAVAMGFDADAYHGTASDISQIDKNMLGSSTGANSAKMAFWAASDPETAVGYSHYAANSAPVRRLIEQANTYERLAQRGGQNSPWWDKYDEALQQADEFEAMVRENRLNGQNVLPLKINTQNAMIADANGAEFVDMEGGVNQMLSKAKRAKMDALILQNLADDVGRNARPATHYGILNPSAVRSRFAAFDPMRRDSSDIMAGIALPVVAAPVISESDKKKRKDKNK